MLKIVNISSGYNVILGWQEETPNYGQAAAVTITAGDATDINRLGIVTDFTLSPALTRHHTYGLGSQTRTNDPILEYNYDWSFSALWQAGGADDTIYQFVKDVLDNYTSVLWESFCFRVDTIPAGGATQEHLYVIGSVVTNVSFKLSAGDVITITSSGFAKDVENGAAARNWGATMLPTATAIPSAVGTDPAAWHEGDVGTWGTIVDVSGQIQDFTVDWNLNCPKIPDFDSGGTNSMSGPGAVEVSWSGTYYGDGTTMGVGAVLSDMAAGVADLVVGLDAGKSLTFVDASIDNMSYPFKEKELIIISFDGKSNHISLN